MLLSQSQMLYAAFWAVLVGSFLGAVYDIFRIVHLAMKHDHKASALGEGLCCAIIFIGDILYALFSAVTICILLYHTNYGRVRYFMFLGAFVGFLLWRFTVGKLLMLAAGAIIALIRALCSFVVHRVLFPLLGILLVIIKFTKFTLAYIPKRLYNIYYRKKRCRLTKKMTLLMIEEAGRGFSL